MSFDIFAQKVYDVANDIKNTIYENRRYTLIGFAVTILTLISVIYVGFSRNNYHINLQKYSLYFKNNYGESSTTRVLCLILTSPNYFLTRTKAVNDTWAPRCDRYFFISEIPPENITSAEYNFTKQIPIAPIKNITPGYDHLTQKVTLAFLFAYENYLNDFDWFVKADDDTYLFVEHLKAFLSEQNASEPITFGYNFKVIVEKGYHSGGASYVLSRESLRRFYQAQNDSNSNCSKDDGSEDVEVAKCLRTKGVYPGKSLDKQNRELFHPLPFTDHFGGTFPDWFASYAQNPPQTGYKCCSDRSISFHYVDPEVQYLMDFLLYKVPPISNTLQKIRKKSKKFSVSVN